MPSVNVTLPLAIVPGIVIASSGIGSSSLAIQSALPSTFVRSPVSVSGIRNRVYTGSALQQTLTVTVGGKTLVNGTDYTVAYKDNKNVGTATVTISGKNEYRGTFSRTFKINPKGTSISKLIKGKKKTYYVQIRTYKTVSGKKYCSKWSKTKSVKTK